MMVLVPIMIFFWVSKILLLVINSVLSSAKLRWQPILVLWLISEVIKNLILIVLLLEIILIKIWLWDQLTRKNIFYFGT